MSERTVAAIASRYKITQKKVIDELRMRSPGTKWSGTTVVPDELAEEVETALEQNHDVEDLVTEDCMTVMEVSNRLGSAPMVLINHLKQVYPGKTWTTKSKLPKKLNDAFLAKITEHEEMKRQIEEENKPKGGLAKAEPKDLVEAIAEANNQTKALITSVMEHYREQHLQWAQVQGINIGLTTIQTIEQTATNIVGAYAKEKINNLSGEIEASKAQAEQLIKDTVRSLDTELGNFTRLGQDIKNQKTQDLLTSVLSKFSIPDTDNTQQQEQETEQEKEPETPKTKTPTQPAQPPITIVTPPPQSRLEYPQSMEAEGDVWESVPTQISTEVTQTVSDAQESETNKAA